MGMDMLRGAEIAQARLDDWRKLAQGLHARYLVPDFATAARLVVAVGEAGDALGHHPRVRIGEGYVDLEVWSDDGTELGLNTSTSATVAPFWAALLTGDPASQGHGTPGDEIRDPTVRVPNLWFGDLEEGTADEARFHVEVYVAPEQVAGRVAAALAAGGTVVDDGDAPGLTVLADPDGNRGVLCSDTSAVPTD